MSVPMYPAYQESGVPWIGRVPASWTVLPMKRAVQIITDRAASRVFPVGLEHIESWSGRLLATEAEFEGEGIAFLRGDLLFGKLRPYLAKAWLADRPGEAVGDFHVLRSRTPHDPRYLQRVLLSREVISLIDGSTYGAKMPRASWEFIGGLSVPLPPPAEQRAIAAFLDRETGKIDALVAEQERLIALLKEKRQAVISQAVTKGLDPNAPMKDSGVEWLGEVPAHWEVAPIKAVASFTGGGTPSREVTSFWNGDIPWVSPKDMKSEVIKDSEEGITEAGLAAGAASLIDPNAVLIVVRSGILRHTIPVAINEQPVALNQDMKALRLNGLRCKPRFVLRLIQGMNELFLNLWLKQGATVESIEHEYLARTDIPLPPLAEQSRITAFVDCECSKIDTLTAEARRAIAFLKERRAALISAAVTGKIDVRGLVAPDEAKAA